MRTSCRAGHAIRGCWRRPCNWRSSTWCFPASPTPRPISSSPTRPPSDRRQRRADRCHLLRALAEFNQIHLDQARQYGERALALAKAAGSEVGAASAELVIGLEQMCLGSDGRSRAEVRAGDARAGQAGPPRHALEAVGYSGLLHAWQLEYQTAGDALDWCLQKAHELGLSYYIILNLFVRGMARFNQGRLSEGLRDLHEGMRLAEKNGERFWLSRYPNTLGWATANCRTSKRRCVSTGREPGPPARADTASPRPTPMSTWRRIISRWANRSVRATTCSAPKRFLKRTCGFDGATTSAPRRN